MIENVKLAAQRRITIKGDDIREYTAIIERCPATKLYVAYIPGFAGAHSQGATLDEVRDNLHEVVLMLLEDDHPSIPRKS